MLAERLSLASLGALKRRGIATPGYNIADVSIGVVHVGPGAFHRVHQAHYFDRLLERDPNLGICEVALQSSGVRDALAPQDGLYTLAILDAESSIRVIGAAREFLVARESTEAVVQRLAHPDTKLITATITEKGYCLNADGLDFQHADIQHDLSHPNAPLTFIGYLAESLRRRKEHKTSAPIVLSCDNLTDNGHRLRRAAIQFAARRDANLAAWIENEVVFPRTMVDSITPATDDALRARIAENLQYVDAWPVQREAFTQWVIERHRGDELIDWASVDVALTNDVSGYERAKLRLLNGAHSSLAYIGSLAGLEFVSEAMAHRPLADFIRTLMRNDIAPLVHAPRELDVATYIDSLLHRFRNPSLPHRLAQIAWDGSQKIPFRLLGTISDALDANRSIERLCFPIAAWFHFIRRKARTNDNLVDPLAHPLLDIGRRCSGNANVDVALFLSLTQVFPIKLAEHANFKNELQKAYARLESLNSAHELANVLP